MNIKILDSWLRDYLKTSATPQQIAEKLSLSSVSVEKIEKFKNDLVYDIEVTTNRPELMSLVGLAREAAAVLNQNGIHATFAPIAPQPDPLPKGARECEIVIKNNPALVNRICAVVMDVTIKPSPQHIQDRLESTDIRSLNNVIDITNYVMRVIGHPTHVFDYDRLNKHILTIRESQKEEKIMTLDEKEYSLPGEDIVAEDGQGIVDLLGVMGLKNSVVSDETKRILFFIDNVEPTRIRKTSMALGIRTEAAVLNEKGVDPELAMDALLYGISLYEELADAKIVSEIVDIYPNKVKAQTVTVTEEQINKVIGVTIPLKKSQEILESLGFTVDVLASRSPLLLGPDVRRPPASEARQGWQGQGEVLGEGKLVVTPPSFRTQDIEIPEDIIEEIARVYGYHNIPNTLPAVTSTEVTKLENNELYWEDRVKDALKYWGFTEVYTYPMVSEAMYEGPIDDAVTIQNPLSDEFTYMRRTLVPSLLKIVKENQGHDVIKIFEIANVYSKKANDLPEQTIKLAGVIKTASNPSASLRAGAAGAEKLFYKVKGIIEQLLTDLGITSVIWKQLENGGQGASIYLSSRHSELVSESPEKMPKQVRHDKIHLGDIEILDDNLIDFELDLQALLKHATLKKTYKPLSKYPPIVEDIALIVPANVAVADIIELIKKQSSLITEVFLLDKYQNTRTFHIVYQSHEKNLTDKEVGEIREKILKVVKEKLNVKLKE